MHPRFKSSDLVPVGFVVDHLDVGADRIGLVVRSGAAATTCPDCRTPSRRIQSRYQRRAADLPLGGRRVELQVVVRRFWCDAAACGRKIFAERFPDDVLPAFARRTSRLAVAAPGPRSGTHPVENVWQFIRDNWLGDRIFASYEDILDRCCDAWNRLTDQPWKMMSIRLRHWAHRH